MLFLWLARPLTCKLKSCRTVNEENFYIQHLAVTQATKKIASHDEFFETAEWNQWCVERAEKNVLSKDTWDE